VAKQNAITNAGAMFNPKQGTQMLANILSPLAGTPGGTQTFAPGLLNQAAPLLGDIQSRANQLMNVGAPDIPSDEALWNLGSQRYLATVRPGMAARGFLTSGNASRIEGQGLQDLATQFSANQFSQGLQRAQFKQQGVATSMQGLLDSLRAILGQGTTSTTGTPGMLSQIVQGMGIATRPSGS
jgi:hypothetical protein